MTPADYGLFGLAAVYVGLATILSQFGVAVALVQRFELTPRYVRAGFTVSVLAGLLTTALVWVTAPLAARALGSVELTSIIRGLSLSFVLGNPGLVAEALSQRKLAWRRLMWIEVTAFVIGNALPAIALALAGYGVWALVGSSLAQSLVRTVALLKLEPHPKWPRIGPEIRELLRFGSGFTLARIFNYGALQGDNLIVGRVLGIVALGYYGRAFKLMMILVTYFASVVTRVLFPIMSRLQDDPERLRSTYLSGAAVLGLVSAPLGAILVVLAPEFVLVVLGPTWLPTILPFQILTAGIMLRNVYLMAYCLDGALGALRRRTVRDGIYALAVLAGSLLGTRFGLVGVATGVVIAIAVNYFVGAAMSLTLLKATWLQYARSQVPAVMLGILTAGVAYALRWGLLQAGAPPFIVLAVTGFVSLAVVGGLCLIRPSVLGVYGEPAVRHFVSAVWSRLSSPAAS
ncbi:MAG: lipopolysaccharide biosynthesis protein [Gemmatimonadales bacterium]|nr:lipopolysaccharide biosynthesis protein [Gemmatimonadales bacterium]